MSVGFIDKSFNAPDDTECSICFDGKDGIKEHGYFIIHEGPDGLKHPMHRLCVRDWIIDNNTCPGGCGAKISNKLVSPLETAQVIAGATYNGAAAGVNSVDNKYLIAAFATITTASLIFFGERLIRDSLAFTGTTTITSIFGGIAGRWTGNGAGASHRIEVMGPIAALTGGILGIGTLALRMTQDAYLLQALAVGTFAKSAGLTKTATSAGIGLGAGLVQKALLSPSNWDKTISTLAGGLGTLVNGNPTNWFVHILPVLAGMRASDIMYDQYGPVAAAAIGTAVSGVSKVIFDKAFNAEQPER